LHAADRGDTVSLPVTLEAAMEQLAALDAARTPEAPAELIAAKGYHSRDTLVAPGGRTLEDARVGAGATDRRSSALARRSCRAAGGL
jgi:hypothetical protein